ncbi:hypothetical protein [[Mycoplasma] testudinis]|uniref:hypothetical protein n=1 Tax=[Mycoplasma] testudinis TaxID=33924 RepID=UPI0004877C6E|nr:hypothetical protein [[Mycoplasma] testudinis]
MLEQELQQYDLFSIKNYVGIIPFDIGIFLLLIATLVFRYVYIRFIKKHTTIFLINHLSVTTIVLRKFFLLIFVSVFFGILCGTQFKQMYEIFNQIKVKVNQPNGYDQNFSNLILNAVYLIVINRFVTYFVFYIISVLIWVGFMIYDLYLSIKNVNDIFLNEWFNQIQNAKPIDLIAWHDAFRNLGGRINRSFDLTLSLYRSRLKRIETKQEKNQTKNYYFTYSDYLSKIAITLLIYGMFKKPASNFKLVEQYFVKDFQYSFQKKTRQEWT